MIENKLIRLSELTQIVGLCRTSIYVKLKQGDFPRLVRIGSKAVAWKSEDIKAWVDSRSKVSERYE